MPASTLLSGDLTTQAAKLNERSLALIALAGISALAWAYTIYFASGMQPASGHTMSMGAQAAQAWGVREIAFTFLMWAVMMVAMMTPSATPMVLTFAAIASGSSSRYSTSLFVTGYLVIWMAFSVAATVLQWLLHFTGTAGSGAESVGPIIGAGLLIVAGAYQFTELKHVCLSRCRSPANFLMTEWRSGPRGAFIMGVRHGMYCVGCCWMLMLLLFVAGVMNLLWVAAIAAVIFLEKTLPADKLVSRAIGIAAILSGVGLLL